jgi:UDP-N-acetylglucosamine 2-epimerase (non-hydrolysing)
VVVTDSGGLQEEASWLGVPVVVLRRSTPRWESVAAGTSVLTGMDAERALAAVLELVAPDAQARVTAIPCPYGDGHTAGRVAALLKDPATHPLLRLEEPDYVDRAPPT